MANSPKPLLMAALAIIGLLFLAACQSSITSQNTRTGYSAPKISSQSVRERWRARVVRWHERVDRRKERIRIRREERMKKRLAFLAARSALNDKMKDSRKERIRARREALLQKRLASLSENNKEQETIRTAEIPDWRKRLEVRREKLRARREARIEKRFAGAEKSLKNRDVQTTQTFAARFEREDTVSVWQRYKRLDKNAVKKSGTKATRKISGPKSGGKGKYDRLIAKYARQHGVPYKLARAVVQVESTFRPHVTGAAGEIGLMQIKLATARGMGYKGSRKGLYDPATNLYWGMKYLGRAHQLASGSTCGTILKYNAGHGAKRMNKISARYCGRVQRILA